ncbi:hypothetical protein ACFYNZ_10240 [Streptomyces kebangsaanensis]|uniref:Uncharacterized protein n=1 Tax=Streptomyces kebangsaanensis TaxID=864058 RepID=A0ABW6KTW3_9ACTN
MALFKKKGNEQTTAPAWSPRVDLASAGPIVHALAQATASNDAQIRSAIAAQVRASDAPTDETVIAMNIQSDPTLVARPWIWLIAVQREAVAAGDHHLSAAALLWAGYFTHFLVPIYPRPIDVWFDTQLDLIPSDLKTEILALGTSSANQLPPDFAIVSDATGAFTAELLTTTAASWLGN